MQPGSDREAGWGSEGKLSSWIASRPAFDAESYMLRLMQHKVTFRYRQIQVRDGLQGSEITAYFHPMFAAGRRVKIT